MDGPTSDVAGTASGAARFEGRAMASPLRLVVHGLQGDEAAEAWGAVRDEFEACEEAMSRFRETSELTALNRASAEGRSLRVERRLRRALVSADRARRVTGGRFNARRLRDLDRLGYRGVPIDGGRPGESGAEPREGEDASEPADAALAEEGRLESDRLLVLEADGSIRLPEPVDLGGIGKGLALRWSAARLRALLPEDGGALLEAGGDVVAIGPAPDEEAWLVGAEDPSGAPAPLAVVALLDAALATSSIAVHAWTSATGERVHHLLDPETGAPGGDGIIAVTVHGADPAWAEVRTKQLFLAGREGIGSLARSLGLAAWWVTDGGVLSMTPAARLLTAWTAPSTS